MTENKEEVEDFQLIDLKNILNLNEIIKGYYEKEYKFKDEEELKTFVNNFIKIEENLIHRRIKLILNDPGFKFIDLPFEILGQPYYFYKKEDIQYCAASVEIENSNKDLDTKEIHNLLKCQFELMMDKDDLGPMYMEVYQELPDYLKEIDLSNIIKENEKFEKKPVTPKIFIDTSNILKNEMIC